MMGGLLAWLVCHIVPPTAWLGPQVAEGWSRIA
jgi:hypothetical protein